jgi:hypothetical protein
MANLAKVGALVLFLVAGCALRTPAELRTEKQLDVKQPPPNANRIEITSSFSSGIYGGPTMGAKWVLEKEGPCRGYVTTGCNTDGLKNSTTEYELPPVTFEECRALLESTRFFDTHVKRPEFLFEASSWGIAATFNGRSHSVNVYSEAPPTPKGLIQLRDFLGQLPSRGKVISSRGPAVP